MSLAQYRKKRKFKNTPEPKGSEKTHKGPLSFVVQKHEASHLHYDFRLELDGVLKSWAVPKGPSLNPEDKRLAMMVEDHPLDYEDFEGIIPKGNYGGGTVMVWDKGVYSPLDTVDRRKAEVILQAQLHKGHLTFVLLGEKLKGEFALIKTPNAGDNAWLLIKKNDEYASKKDILLEDKSVISGRSMNEIAKQAEVKNEVWYGKTKDSLVDLEDAPEKPIPHFISPMLAETTDKPFDKIGWIFEMKWDGYRAISVINSGKVNIYSRNQLSFNERFSKLVTSLSKFPTNAVIDGEVVVVDSKGKANFQWIQDYPKSINGELRYYVFDLLYYDGYDLKDLPLIRRKEILKTVLHSLPYVFYSDHIEDEGISFFKQAEKLHLEGIIAKDGQSKYKEGVRSKDWLKIKTSLFQEAFICGFTSPNGSRKNFGALILGVLDKGKLRYIGHTGGGFDDELLESIYNKLKPLVVTNCPFEEVPRTNNHPTWTKPIIKCEVTFTGWTEEKVMRHPVFYKLIDNEDNKENKKTFESDSLDENSSDIKLGKINLKLTNLSKVFWPKERYTKGDLIEYYKTIAPGILPHLINRPQSLLRYPDGINGKSFFQKNAGNLTASFVKRVKIHSDSGEKDVEYLLCQDEASLLYIVNLGCIDLNPWNSRIGHLDKPDYLIIDLDPEGVSFKNVVKVALVVRDVLEKFEIESYPKTSGARGIHIYIPVGAKYTYDQARNFAELLCIQVHNKIPSLTSMVRNPKDRQGKVYLDFLQNSKGQTLASVYSVRAEPEATISTPLKWKEVTSKLSPTQFTIKNILRRLHKYGDLFKPVLGKGINIERILSKMTEVT